VTSPVLIMFAESRMGRDLEVASFASDTTILRNCLLRHFPLWPSTSRSLVRRYAASLRNKKAADGIRELGIQPTLEAYVMPDKLRPSPVIV